MSLDPKVRKGLAKEGRLWLLALVCAAPGAIAATHYNSFWAGAGVFAACLGVFAPLLFLYERRRRGPARGTAGAPGRAAEPAPRLAPPSVNERYGQQKRRRHPPAGGR